MQLSCITQLRYRFVKMATLCDLAFFTCEVVGIKFYGLGRRLARSATRVYFEREPGNPHDANAVLCYAMVDSSRRVLGHVSAKAARWLSPLLQSPFTAAGMVLLDEHSTNSISRSWRYRAITVSVAIIGPPSYELDVRDVLLGAESDLDDLVLGNDDGLGDRRLERL